VLPSIKLLSKRKIDNMGFFLSIDFLTIFGIVFGLIVGVFTIIALIIGSLPKKRNNLDNRCEKLG